MPRVGATYTKNIRESLERINLGNPASNLGLRTWPLLGPDLDGENYSLLDASIKEGKCEVKETARETVDTVVVVNQSEASIFAMHGQLLRGAKQNRAINLTTMFPPESETTIHVACVEQGRWNTGRSFSEASWVQSAAGRSEKLGSVLDDLERTGAGKADQQRVWSQQGLKERILNVQSYTHDEIEIQERGLDLEASEAVAEWPLEADQVGVILFANNLWAIELFDTAETYASFQPSLLRSFALEAVEARRRHISPIYEEPRTLLDFAWRAGWRSTQTHGAGHLLANNARGKRQCALVWKDTCVSLSSSGRLAHV